MLAKEQGIGTANYQRKLDSSKQSEIRSALPSIIAERSVPISKSNGTRRQTPKSTAISSKKTLKAAIEYLIQDEELFARCGDILMAKSNFDRPINQATLVLEERIRRKAKLEKKLVGESLVNASYKDDLSQTVLQIESGDAEDQRGYLQILRGIVPTFRNKTHHHLISKFSREDAIRVCGFIDVLLRVVDNSQKVR